MSLVWITLQVLITAYSIASPEPRYQMAAKMPQDDSIYINTSAVIDLNEDGMPEVCLAASSGWKYYVYYYLDGDVCSVEDLTPWAWSSNLCYTTDNRLVMCAYAHTTGTAGIAQYRVYEWTPTGYHMAEDLWSMPCEWDSYGNPVSLEYISSEKAIDPFEMEDYSELLITQQEFDQKIADFGELTSIFYEGGSLYTDAWEQDAEADEIYRGIQKEILNWNSDKIEKLK